MGVDKYYKGLVWPLHYPTQPGGPGGQQDQGHGVILHDQGEVYQKPTPFMSWSRIYECWGGVLLLFRWWPNTILWACPYQPPVYCVFFEGFPKGRTKVTQTARSKRMFKGRIGRWRGGRNETWGNEWNHQKTKGRAKTDWLSNFLIYLFAFNYIHISLLPVYFHIFHLPAISRTKLFCKISNSIDLIQWCFMTITLWKSTFYF